jgi:hypothetical protein
MAGRHGRQAGMAGRQAGMAGMAGPAIGEIGLNCAACLCADSQVWFDNTVWCQGLPLGI